MITIRWYDKKGDIEAKAMRQSIQLSGHESVRQKIRRVPKKVLLGYLGLFKRNIMFNKVAPLK